ncbi:MAG: uroporphyrinogen decarboxylase [Proteobacteria bacterium]|nr:uroporphyrinogen decarboxylase [Pseudomonadota bacterium]
MTVLPPGKKLLRVLAGEIIDPPPIWLMRQAGRYLPEYRALRAQTSGFLELCLTPALAAEVTLQPIRRYAMDGAILFSDILMVPYGLGQAVSFRDGEGPVLEPITSAVELGRLQPVGVRDRVAPIAETVQRVRAELPDGVTLIGFAGSPWTVATYMVEGGSSREFARTKRWLYGDPVGFAALIAQLIETTVDYLCLQIEAGVEAVQLFDSWAGVLASPAFERWVVEPNVLIIAALNERHPEIPVILFPRGAGVNYGSVIDIGAAALGLDTAVPVDWAHETLQPHVALQGNLDPQVLVTGGDAMSCEVRRIRSWLGGGPFIFNLGHGVVPETPPEHVAELVRLVGAPS